ncbi:MAG TPA: alpha/beta fold hydrolase [Acidimicrobiales bacterium]|nr:alpha/beta fold hydrolase [Acidimicrobiales bacterium]
MLHADVLGAGPRVVLVHGFTQTGRSWGIIAARLSRSHEVVLLDAPGHGRSSSIRTGLWDGARLIGETGGRAAYVGYSMGGRYCLHLALDRANLVERLVLVGATAGIEDARERMERRKADSEWAQLVIDEGVERFIDRWLSGPLFAHLDPIQAGRDTRLENTPLGLASSLRLAGTGTQEPLWDRLPELTMPVLLVVGERDEKFRSIAERMAAAIGRNAAVEVIPGAGHAVHLERPDAFGDVVAAFVGESPAH